MKIKKIVLGIVLAFSIIQITSFANTSAERTKENGIYKIALGADASKTIEISESDTSDNAKVDIWDYRKCISPKVLL